MADQISISTDRQGTQGRELDQAERSVRDDRVERESIHINTAKSQTKALPREDSCMQ